MCVTRSNNNVYVQIIDDVAHKTLLCATTLGAEFNAPGKKSGTVEVDELSIDNGTPAALLALHQCITFVSEYRYHTTDQDTR